MRGEEQEGGEKDGESEEKGGEEGGEKDGEEDGEKRGEKDGEVRGEEGGKEDGEALNRPQHVGAGRKKASKGIKKKTPLRPERVKGHRFNPKWLDTHPWLRTMPDRTSAEWRLLPEEAPQYIFCACCVEAAPRAGHKDVLVKKVKESVRSDKVKAHAKNIAHARALEIWERRQCVVDSPSTPASTPASDALAAVDASLAALVRTVMVVAVTKSALCLVDTYVKLQACWPP